MDAINKKIRSLLRAWDSLLRNEKEAMELSNLALSALSAWVPDCFESGQEIYSSLFDKLKNAPPDGDDLIHDCVVDIYWHLQHIKSHIVDAEAGFQELIRVLADKAESKEDT